MSVGAPTIWEQRFPTFVGGSPSPSVSRPSVSAIGSRGAKLLQQQMSAALTHPLRPGQSSPAPAGDNSRHVSIPRALTPSEAIKAADDAARAALQFSSTSIVAGSPARPTTQHVQGRPTAPGRPATVPALPLGRTVAATTSESTNEYDEFLQSIERLQARLQHIPLHKRWRLMSGWLDRFVYDEVAERLVKGASQLYRALDLKSPQAQLKPHSIKTAVSFMLLEQILFIIGHSFPDLDELACQIRDDMLDAVYLSPDTKIDLSGSFFVMEDPTDPLEQQRLISRFYKKTYFNKLREVSTKLTQKQIGIEATERTKDKQMRILNRIVLYWQKYTKRIVFRSWRGYIGGKKAKRQAQEKLKQIESKLTSVTDHYGGRVDQREREFALMTSKCESLTADLEEARGYLSDLEKRNKELEEGAAEMHKNFYEDGRVKSMMREIEELKSRNAELRSALAGGDEAIARLLGQQDGSLGDGDASNEDPDSSNTPQKLRRQLALAQEHIRELEARQQPRQA